MPNKTADLEVNIFGPQTVDLTGTLDLAIAETASVLASTELVVAEQYAGTAELQPAIAATSQPAASLDVVVAEANQQSASLDVFASGSTYLDATLRVTVGEALQLTGSADVAVAGSTDLTADLDVSLTDAVRIVLEPDAPTVTPLVTVDDLVLSVHPNAISSPTRDFAALGVVPGDVLQLYSGGNAGHYLVKSVQTNVLFVHQIFADRFAVGPVAGEIRRPPDISATLTAALVLDQALFFAPTRRIARLDIVID